MTPLQEQVLALHHQLPEGVRLVAVSKFHPVPLLLEAYDVGQRIFGESRVQELQDKQQSMPADCEWHFIGHLQTNKVKYIAPYVSLIHAVDSLRLLQEIDRQGELCGRCIRVLLQVHVAQEESKFGFRPEQLRAFLNDGRWRELPHVEICGLMAMGSFTDDMTQVSQEFRLARELFEWARDKHFAQQPSFCECSWGMSDDYPLAIEEGSTLVRIGSKIFGARD